MVALIVHSRATGLAGCLAQVQNLLSLDYVMSF